MLRNLPRGRGQDRDLVYLIQLARRHNLDPSVLHDSLLAARQSGKAQCGEFLVETRLRGENSSTYMFSVKGEPSAQANIQDDSIRKLKRLPAEFSRFLEDEKRSDSGELRGGSQSAIGSMRFGLRGLSFKARVVKKSDVRAVNSKDGTPLLVCDVTLADGTGEIPLAIWNDQIRAISEGDLVQIQNARVRSFRGEIQLSLQRKNGALTVLETANSERTRL